MRNINVTYLGRTSLEAQPVEYVERKGKGHPDSLIDGIVEKASIELGRAYKENAGMVLHHNVDKGLIVGGESVVSFGSGRITKPVEVIVAGRATRRFEGKNIPVDAIVIKAAKDYLRENTRFLDLNKEVRFVTKIQKGSADLNGVFARRAEVPLANDTSFGIGFAPFTETESLTLNTERYLNGAAYKKRMPAVGEDIKVMGVREGDKIMLTVAIAFVAKYVKSIDDYISQKERIRKDILSNARKYTKREVTAIINNGDSHSTNDIYLTKSGLSCEAGDDGSVGRGNRVNGLITPFRHMTLEAAHGKNPINHVGKIYSIISNEIAKDVVSQYPQIKDCTVYIVSQIGRPIDDPKNLNLELVMDDKRELDRIRSKVAAVAEGRLSDIVRFSDNLVRGKYDIVS